MNFLGFSVALCALIVCSMPSGSHASVVHSAAVAAAPECSATLPITASYLQSQCRGAVMNLSNPHCWSPAGVPAPNATIAIVSLSSAQPLLFLTTSVLRVSSLVIPAGSAVVMQSSAWEVSTCLQVYGTLRVMSASAALQDPTFLPDPSVPQGTDCSKVPLGFTSRVCGPGAAYVAPGATLQAAGMYASIWTRTAVAGTLSLDDGSFLWGNTTILTGGSAVASTIYFHGELHIQPGATVTVQQLRVDKWGLAWSTSSPQLVIVNQGTLTFEPPLPSNTVNIFMWDMVSTNDGGTQNAQVLLLNYGSMSFLTQFTNLILFQSLPFGGLNMNMINHGSVMWSGNQQYFTGTGSTVNYGHFWANSTTVYLSDYATHGGTLNTTNGGYFYFGNGAGPDVKTVVECDRDRHAEVEEEEEVEEKEQQVSSNARPVVLADAKTTNPRSTIQNCSTSNDCSTDYCCVNGVCEAAACYMFYGGDACCGCCGNGPNGACSPSSHGPYCGGSLFEWEVDPSAKGADSCADGVEFVDRLNFEKMRARFEHVALPRFSRNSRYLFEGPPSLIVGDGTGAVLFNEPLEIRRGSKLIVRDGGVLRNLIDGNIGPFMTSQKSRFVTAPRVSKHAAAAVEIDEGGEFGAGIKSVYDSDVALRIRSGGTLYVSQYSQVRLHKHHNIVLDPHAHVIVNGKILSDAATKDPLLLLGRKSANVPLAKAANKN